MKEIRLILTGVTLTIIAVWIMAGGFKNLTEIQIIMSLFTAGLTCGMWINSLKK